MKAQQHENNPNENSLAGMSCPKCGDFGPFKMHVSQSGVTIVTDMGTDFVEGPVEWDDASACHCLSCGHDGTVGEFKGEAAPAQAGKAETVMVSLAVLSRLIDMAREHVSDIETGIEDGTYLASENADLGAKQKTVKEAEAACSAAALSAQANTPFAQRLAALMAGECICPFCGGEHLDYGSGDFGSEASQEAFCMDCGANWSDQYRMTRIVVHDAGSSGVTEEEIAAANDLAPSHEAEKEIVRSIQMQDIVGEYDNPDDVKEWGWIKANASYTHVHHGQEGIWEFVLNLSRDFEDVPALLEPVLIEARSAGIGYLIFHQGI